MRTLINKIRLVALLALFPTALMAGSTPEFTLIIKNHRFQPAELHIPAGKKVKLIVVNQDATAEEFESYPLNREKIIAPLSKAVIFIGPLKPGRYPFFGEFNMKTAQGVVIAE